MTNNVSIALLMTLLAGLSTGIGGLSVLLFKKTNTKLLSIALGFSAGVMIYISFVEILYESRITLIECMGTKKGELFTVISFFAGIGIIALIDKLVPEYENPHETRKIEDINNNELAIKKSGLLRTGILTALAITIHNFPEGIASFISGVKSPTLGIAIAVAIAIHNIPEGIAVSVPVYFSTGSKKKGFLISLLSGLTEPLGAIIAYLILLPFINDQIFGMIFGAIAGIMVYISLDELLPASRKYGEHHLSILGLILGMFVMAISLIIL